MNEKLKKVFKILFFITLFASIIFLLKSSPVGWILLFASIWIHPITCKLLQKIRLYLYDTSIVIGYIILILISVGTFFINQRTPTETLHKHIATEWIFDEMSGYEYKECSVCGELLDKRVPDLKYSDLEEKEKEEE